MDLYCVPLFCLNLKFILQLITLTIGLIGTCLEFFAAINLFKLTKGLKEITPFDTDVKKPFDIRKNATNRDLETRIDDAIKDTTAQYKALYLDLVERINIQIRDVNKHNEDGFKEDKEKWINQIYLGVVLTIFSMILSFIVSVD